MTNAKIIIIPMQDGNRHVFHVVKEYDNGVNETLAWFDTREEAERFIAEKEGQ